MSPSEAAAVAEVVAAADGHCMTCASYAACHLAKLVPWHNWFALVADASDGKWSETKLREWAPCEPDR